MKCQNCGENEANFKYTEILNGNKVELFLCEDCYKKLGFDNIQINLPINFSNFFADFLESYEMLQQHIPLLVNETNIKCGVCNTTYEEFVKTGKLGCPNCYNAFSNKLEPILKRIQNNTIHIGKKGEISEEVAEIQTVENAEILKLKSQLKKLIKEENYEEAAKVRDEIKRIEQGGE